MEFGAIFPTAEIGNDPIVVRDFAQAAEELGYAHISCYDHVVGGPHEGRAPPLDGPYTDKDPFHEPIALFGFLAAATRRILLGTGVMILPQRQTVLVAKQMAELQLLSGGRMILGVGTGWNPVEYEALGADFANRGAVLDEQVVLLRRLWSEPLVDFRGAYHRVDRAGILPLPETPIPIFMGGFGRRPIDRAVRLGDGYIFGGSPKAAELCRYLLDELRVAGRDPATFPFDFTVSAHAEARTWHETVETWSALGARYVSLRTMGPPGLHVPGRRFATPREHIAALETFMREMKQYRV